MRTPPDKDGGVAQRIAPTATVAGIYGFARGMSRRVAGKCASPRAPKCPPPAALPSR